MLRELLHWFTDAVEVVAAVGGILTMGLIVALAAFWILAHILGVFTHPEPEFDWGEQPEDDTSLHEKQSQQ